MGNIATLKELMRNNFRNYNSAIETHKLQEYQVF